jgi:hypothetical protein
MNFCGSSFSSTTGPPFFPLSLASSLFATALFLDDLADFVGWVNLTDAFPALVPDFSALGEVAVPAGVEAPAEGFLDESADGLLEALAARALFAAGTAFSFGGFAGAEEAATLDWVAVWVAVSLEVVGVLVFKAAVDMDGVHARWSGDGRTGKLRQCFQQVKQFFHHPEISPICRSGL